MIAPILFLTTIFIGIGFIVTVDNARYLLSGYNTMSDEERDKIDIISYIAYFKKFHISLGISFLAISIILLYFVNSDWSALFVATYPLLAYVFLIWKGQKFSRQISRKQKISTYAAIAILSTLVAFIAYDVLKQM